MPYKDPPNKLVFEMFVMKKYLANLRKKKE